MDGVHASCVEAWVRHQRQTFGTVPQCSVCCTPYLGAERPPGFRQWLHHLLQRLSGQVLLIVTEGLRFAIDGAMILRYSEIMSIEDEDEMSPPCAHSPALKPWNPDFWKQSCGRKSPESFEGELAEKEPLAFYDWLFVVLFLVFLAYNAAVLLVSTSQRPPAGRIARYLHTTDVWCLARHAAELMATALLLGWRCLAGCVRLWAFLPCLLALIAPFYRWITCVPFSVLSAELRMCFPALAVFPGRVCRALCSLLQAHQGRLLNPLYGSLHVVLGLIAVAMCLAFQSRTPVLIFFVAHSVILALGILEKLLVRRLTWHEGQGWWCAWMIALQAVSITFDRRWLTLLILLVALRALERTMEGFQEFGMVQPDVANNTLWWCTLLTVVEVVNMWLHEYRGAPVRTAQAQYFAAMWFGLIGGLALAVNWNRCVGYYRQWQRRNAHFVLCIPPQPGEQQPPFFGPAASGAVVGV